MEVVERKIIMSRWFRYYDDALNDPKVQRLSGDLFKAWVNLLCLASQSGGTIKSLADAAFALRLPEAKAGSVVAQLANYQLLDPVKDGYFSPHNWDKRQYKSDVSNERVKRHRKRECNVTSTVAVTPPDTESETDTEKNKGPSAQSKFYFEGTVIRLTAEGYAKWRDAYPRVTDLKAVLQKRDDWLSQQEDRKNWFVSTSNWLANENQKAAAEAQVAKLRPGWTPIPASGII